MKPELKLIINPDFKPPHPESVRALKHMIIRARLKYSLRTNVIPGGLEKAS